MIPIDDSDSIRSKAEAMHKSVPLDSSLLSRENALRTVYELEVHKTELELQNETLRRMQQALDASYQRYRQLFENAPIGYLSLDNQRVIHEANLAASQLLGLPRFSLRGMHLEQFAALSSHSSLYLHLRTAMQTKELQFSEVEFHRPDNVNFWGRVCTLCSPEMDTPVTYLTMISDISHQKQSQELLEWRVKEKTNDLRVLLSRYTKAQEEERFRIASDLHDEVGQLLSACQIKLANVAKSVQPECLEEVQDIEILLDCSIQRIRTIVFDMASTTLHKAGFTDAARELCHAVENRFPLDIRWVQETAEIQIPLAIGSCLYYCLRELLNNIVRHAHADHVEVRFGLRGDQLCLQVSDDGAGFSFDPKQESFSCEGGFGLYSIQERLYAIGGELHVSSVLHEGSRIRITARHDGERVDSREAQGA